MSKDLYDDPFIALDVLRSYVNTSIQNTELNNQNTELNNQNTELNNEVNECNEEIEKLKKQIEYLKKCVKYDSSVNKQIKFQVEVNSRIKKYENILYIKLYGIPPTSFADENEVLENLKKCINLYILDDGNIDITNLTKDLFEYIEINGSPEDKIIDIDKLKEIKNNRENLE